MSHHQPHNSVCQRCVLPQSGHKISLDKTGVCNLCQRYDRHQDSTPQYLETDFVKLLKDHPGKGQYDCLVMCSGGKDSTLALYYMVKKYKRRVLAFTFDHGFENEHALANIKAATEKLGIDWLYLKTGFMKDAFKAIVENQAKTTICHICSLWYTQLSYGTAARYEIPLLIGGWRKEQAQSGETDFSEYEYLSRETEDFIKHHLRQIPKYRDFPLSHEAAAQAGAQDREIIALSPHWFLPTTPEDHLDLLKNELSWQETPESYPQGSTNCQLNFPSVYLSLKNFGYSHYHIEMSKRIRRGEISRQEALEKLELNFDREKVEEILSKLDCKL